MFLIKYSCFLKCLYFSHSRIGDVMVSVLASSAIDSEFEALSVQAKDYKIGICCFS